MPLVVGPSPLSRKVIVELKGSTLVQPHLLYGMGSGRSSNVIDPLPLVAVILPLVSIGILVPWYIVVGAIPNGDLVVLYLLWVPSLFGDQVGRPMPESEVLDLGV